MKNVVYLIPAPDMDERSVSAIQLEGWRVVPLSLDTIGKETRLQDLIERLRGQITHLRPILIGTCYGGPLALELSKVIEVEKVVLVACVKSRDELTLQWKFLFRCYLLFPQWFEKALGLGLAFFLNKVLRLRVKVPRVWRKSSQNKFIARHLLKFEGNSQLRRVVHIHGKQDALFPIRKIKDVDIMIESGHFMLEKSRRSTLESIHKVLELS